MPDQSVYLRPLFQVSLGLIAEPDLDASIRIPQGLAGLHLVKLDVKSNGEVTLVGGKHTLISAILWLSDFKFVSYTARRNALDMLLDAEV